jgi:hypothetical protein
MAVDRRGLHLNDGVTGRGGRSVKDFVPGIGYPALCRKEMGIMNETLCQGVENEAHYRTLQD